MRLPIIAKPGVLSAQEPIRAPLLRLSGVPMDIQRFRQTKKRLLSFAAATLLAAGFVVSIPAAASAAGPCGSSYALVKSYPMYHVVDDSLRGYLRIYYSSTTGKNCAIASAAGIEVGVTRWRQVGIEISGTNNMKFDGGYYSRYAGPVYTPVSRGRCITAWAFFNTTGGSKLAERWVTNAHCG